MTLQKQVASIALNALLSSQLGTADLSPGKWKPGERSQAEKAEMVSWPPRAKTIAGPSGLVTATMSPIAVRAGIEALRQGGNAADAAATVALTQIATALGSYVSYAGIMQLVYYEASSGKVYSLNAGWGSYLGETDPQTIPVADLGSLPFARKPTAGAEGRKTLVPGFMAGIEAMHRRFGRLPFPTLFQPAISYAESGITVSPLLANYFQTRERYLSRTPEGRAFLNQAGNALPKAGDRFIQTDLAKTLRGVAKFGSSYMYTGEWGQQFVKAVQHEGGKVTLEDMKRYHPLWEEPLTTTFQGHTIYAPGPNNPSAATMLESLNLSEAAQLDRMGPYNKDPKAFQALSKILKAATYDGLPTPQWTAWKRQKGLTALPSARLTKPYAQALASALLASAPDDAHTQPQPTEPHHSDSVVVVDKWGNVAALVHSINTVTWGSTGIVVGGIPLSDAAGFQQWRLAAIKPGDPVPQDEAPVIAMTGHKPALAIATVGASLLPETVRLLVASLANHLNPQAAMQAPPLLTNFQPISEGETLTQRTLVIPEDAYAPSFLQHLREQGIPVEQKSKYQVWAIKGTAAMATIDPQSRLPSAAETPFIFTFAAAY